MKVETLPPVKSSLKPSNHPYLNGPWTPQMEEVTAEDLDVIEGEIPHDIDGIYLRNTENQVHQPLGRHHPFDGDGMIHQISISGGRASYRNRFVRTRCFDAEQIAGRSLWGGLMDGPGVSTRPGFGAHGRLKDSSSTDIVVHAGLAVSTFYQCGEAYLLNPETLESLGPAPWTPLDGVSAHPKVDEKTGELLFFNYSTHAPYMHYGVVDRAGKLVHYVPVELPGPRLPHDMAFTENFVILNDLPVFWDEKLLEKDIHAVRVHDLPSRFGIMPRRGSGDEVRWFEADPTYVLHWTNAYEDGDEIVLDGYFQGNPQPEPLAEQGEWGQLMAYIDQYSLKTHFHRWRFNMKDGTTREEVLDERIVEFGMINNDYLGRPYRYAYSTVPRKDWFLFRGFIKHDLETGTSEEVMLEDGRYASESPFVPRIDAKDEDDGYLVSFVIDENAGRSECILIDCKRFSEGPVCRIALPHKICSGTHSTWVQRSQLDADRAFRRERAAAA